MNYVKNYDVGVIHLDLPTPNYFHELPLFSFGDIHGRINLSLIFNYGMRNSDCNPYNIGSGFKLPTTFDVQNPTVLMYILPVISLSLPSIANLMKWLRRYMIDQMNADYVKFARSGGLSESQIFTKHVLKNAIIPIVHGIPAGVLGALTGAIITERVYMVPGIGNVLTEAINKYDNGVIVGVALFYALLSVTSFILGDVLMSVMDPRISFTAKQR